MTNTTSNLLTNKGLIHKIAVLGKDYYSIARINDLFLFAGADMSWWEEPTNADTISSTRMHRVYGWINGLELHAKSEANKILMGVAQQLIENEQIPEADRHFMKTFFSKFGSPLNTLTNPQPDIALVPDDIHKLLEILIKGLPRAMFPLKFRRKGSPSFCFDDEYDIQTLLHSMLQPWIKDIRPEEYTPSYVGSSTRMDFILPKYRTVCETKLVRDKNHAKEIGNELILDTVHYQAHPYCGQLWIIIYDPNKLIPNPGGLVADLEKNKGFFVRVFIL